MSRLKNCKRTSKCQVFSFTVPEKMVPFEDIEKFLKKKSQCRKTEREDPLGFFNIHSVAKHQKIEKVRFGEKMK